jgi:hypothetical protein
MRFTSILISVLLISNVAFAQTSNREEARRLFTLGSEAYAAEQWDDCASYFERSFTLVFAADLLYNIGVCYENAADFGASEPTEQLTRLRRASAAFSRYLREAGDSAEAQQHLEYVTQRIQETEEEYDAQLEENDRLNEAEGTTDPMEGVMLPEVVVTDSPLSEEMSSDLPSVDLSWPVAFGVTPVDSFALGLVLNLVAAMEFSSLSDTCGGTPEGCDPRDIARVDQLSIASYVMYGVSGAALVATGISLAATLVSYENSWSAHLQYTASF